MRMWKHTHTQSERVRGWGGGRERGQEKESGGTDYDMEPRFLNCDLRTPHHINGYRG